MSWGSPGGWPGRRVVSSVGTSQTAPSGSAATMHGAGTGDSASSSSTAASLRREVRILLLPPGARPAAQDESVCTAAAVDDRERVVCVPAALGEPPQRRDAAPGADRLGHPAQRLLGRAAAKRIIHLRSKLDERRLRSRRPGAPEGRRGLVALGGTRCCSGSSPPEPTAAAVAGRLSVEHAGPAADATPSIEAA